MRPPTRKIANGFGVNALLLTLAILLASDIYAHAYLDPGTGSMVVQLLLGGIAGLGVLLKMSWRRLRNRFRHDPITTLPKIDE